jgi:small-conductance mechanosensitive channel
MRLPPAEISTDLCIKKIKERVLEFDKLARTMAGTLNKVHSTPASQSKSYLFLASPRGLQVCLVPVLVESVRGVIVACKSTSEAISRLVPPNQFWRLKDMWTNSLRSVAYSAVFSEFLMTGTLLPLDGVADQLGSPYLLLSVIVPRTSHPRVHSQGRLEGSIYPERRGLFAWSAIPRSSSNMVLRALQL